MKIDFQFFVTKLCFLGFHFHNKLFFVIFVKNKFSFYFYLRGVFVFVFHVFLSDMLLIWNMFFLINTRHSNLTALKKERQRNPFERSPTRILAIFECPSWGRISMTIVIEDIWSSRIRMSATTIVMEICPDDEHSKIDRVRVDGFVEWVALAPPSCCQFETSDICSCAKKVFVSFKICTE